MLHILMLSAEYPPTHKGGQGVHAGELVAGLGQQGHQVTVFAFTPQVTQVAQPQERVSVHLVAPQTISLQAEMSQQVKRFNEELLLYCQNYFAEQTRPHLIHCQDWQLFPVAQALRQQWGIPIVGTVHLLDEPLQRWWGETPHPDSAAQENRFSHEVDLLITVSHSMAEIIAAAHQQPASKIRVVHNGFNHRPFNQAALSIAAREKLRRTIAAPEEKIVLFAGRLAPAKGLTAFFAAASQVLNVMGHVRYLVIGEATTRAAAQMMDALQQQYMALQPKIKMLGKIPRRQLAMLYQVADIAVVPSIYEPFGYAAAEAMAAGVPVIASNTGGLAEIIIHHETGLLIPIYVDKEGIHQVDAAALAEAQLTLLRDSSLATKLALAGRQRVLCDFTLDKMVAETIQVYHDTLNSWHTKTRNAELETKVEP